MGPGGRLLWALLFTTVGLLWVMMFMKHNAVKSIKTGPAIAVVGFIAGAGMVVVGRIFEKTPLVKDTLVPNGFLILWIAIVTGIWVTIMAIRFNPLKLPVTKVQQLFITIAAIVVLYLIGGFVHAVSILTAWLIMFTILGSISIFIWSLDRRTEQSTWALAITGALATFVLMTLIYAIIPHEWITFATSYLNFTKDAKVSTGGEFVLNTWLGGDFWTERTRILPLEVTYEMLQDQATMAIYVIGAVINVKLFAAWQKRNDPLPAKSEEDEAAPKKTSRFGRPLKSLKASKA